jgi:O-antigen ligase
MEKKIERREDSMTSGREMMWMDRIADFEDSPFIGVGFSSMKEINNSKIDVDSGTVEPGSGWLMVLSSMGLLGFITYLVLIINPIIRIWKNHANCFLPVAIAFFFIIHTLVEGYITSFGSALCAIMWLNISVLYTFSSKHLST